MFCPKCDGLLMPSDGKMKCSCGYVQQDGKIKDSKRAKEKVEVMNKEIEVLPEIDADCDKCKNKRAKFWTVQTRSSDEPETKFYKCTKCGNVWREYD